MARKGNDPRDFRSESERVKQRSGERPLDGEYNRGGRAPEKVPTHPAPEGRPSQETAQTSSALPPEEKERQTKASIERNMRPDKAIKRAVVAQLSSEPDLSTSDITVEVQDRMVLLSGEVDTINTKERAEELAKRIEGVAGVDNQLKIRVGEAFEEFTKGVDASRLREDFARSRHLK